VVIVSFEVLNSYNTFRLSHRFYPSLSMNRSAPRGVCRTKHGRSKNGIERGGGDRSFPERSLELTPGAGSTYGGVTAFSGGFRWRR
jgi:hypothetical protein